jgi:sensor histidine kinase YesM
MTDLESIVKQLYGKRMTKCKAQGNPHFLFNVYEDQPTR